MRIPRSMRMALALGALLAQGCGPLVMLPGGKLPGDERHAPGDWSFSDSIEVVQLETRPTDPYSVNVWGVAHEGAFYVMAGSRENRWVRNIDTDPRVRLKVCEDVYPMTAVVIADEPTEAALIAALAAKYDFTPSADQRAAGRVIRLDPR